MSKENQDERALGLLTALEGYLAAEEADLENGSLHLLCPLEDREPEAEAELEEDFGVWESLSVDMLSDEETKRLAEALAVGGECWTLCAMLRQAGVYEASPFYDRMREYEKNPAAETDENWKRIAFAFRPELEALESGVASRPTARRASEALVDDWEVLRAEAWRASLQRKRRKWANRLGYSAALALVAAIGLVWEGQDASQLPTSSGEAEWEHALGIKGIGALPSEEETRESTAGWGRAPSPGASEEVDWSKEGAGVLRANALPVSAESFKEAAKSYGVLETLEILPFDIGDLDVVYLSGHAAGTNADFNEAEVRATAERCALLVKKLSEAESVDEDALAVARWNLAVVLIKGGDLASGWEILNEMKEMKLNEAMSARVGAAIMILEEDAALE